MRYVIMGDTPLTVARTTFATRADVPSTRTTNTLRETFRCRNTWPEIET
ncbi:hypothetical protein [Microtetraspora malaysiensis]|uniref:Uncharacterized protein n=1 Tax=Microtetraspora malaysiensis TaxID=161358 RepID=A0ABW6SXL8_9ACTN